MAIMRLTSKDALTESNHQIRAFSVILQSMGFFESHSSMSTKFEELEEYATEEFINLSIGVQDTLISQVAELLIPWITQDDQIIQLKKSSLPIEIKSTLNKVGLKINIFLLNEESYSSAGKIKPPILILLFDEQYISNDENQENIYDACQSASLVLLPRLNNIPNKLKFQQRLLQLPCLIQLYHIDSIPEFDYFSSLLQAPRNDVLHLMTAKSISEALNSLTSAFKMVLDQEQTSLMLQKELIKERVESSQQNSQKLAQIKESITLIKSSVQEEFAAFELGMQESNARFLEVPHGKLWSSTEEIVETLQTLEEDDRMEKHISYSIPSQYKEIIKHKQYTSATNHCTRNLQEMSDFFALVSKDIETSLNEIGGAHILPEMAYIPNQRIKGLMDRTFRYDKEYKAQSPKITMKTYLMGMRRYLGIFMMLIMPLLMFTTFMENINSLTDTIDQQSQVTELSNVEQKDEQPQLAKLMRKWALPPISILLIIFGLYETIKTVKFEAKERKEDHVKKAQEYLESEFKRMYSTMQQQWGKLLQQHLKTQLTNLLAQMENANKEHIIRQQLVFSEDKSQAQLQSQGIELKIKKLSSSLRSYGTNQEKLLQFRAELDKLFAGQNQCLLESQFNPALVEVKPLEIVGSNVGSSSQIIEKEGDMPCHSSTPKENKVADNVIHTGTDKTEQKQALPSFKELMAEKHTTTVEEEAKNESEHSEKVPKLTFKERMAQKKAEKDSAV